MAPFSLVGILDVYTTFTGAYPKNKNVTPVCADLHQLPQLSSYPNPAITLLQTRPVVIVFPYNKQYDHQNSDTASLKADIILYAFIYKKNIEPAEGHFVYL